MSQDLNTNKTDPEIELMQRIFESDFDALKVLYGKYSPLLYTFVKKIFKDERVSEEILIDIFSVVEKRINYFDFNTQNSFTWLITIARNKVVYELRIKRGFTGISPEHHDEYIIPKLSHLTEPLDIDKAFELKNNIETALNKLTDAQQYVIYLAFYEGYTQEEISDKLKIPLSTVKSKIKTSLINLNENFKEKSSLFSIKNEIVEQIYPFALGCLSYEEQLNTFNRFKASEPFPWKLLAEYQNLAALLPVILDPEKPAEAVDEKILSRIYELKNIKKEDKIKSFERVSSASSQLKVPAGEENPGNEYLEIAPGEIKKPIETFDEEVPKGKKISKDEFDPVIPLKPRIDRNETGYLLNKKKNYSSIIIIGLIVLYVASAVMAYLFYKDRALFYENEIENISGRMEALNKEYRNRPEIPGLSELKNSHTIKLTNSGSAFSSGEIIFSYEDKRGYLHINSLPILNSDNAYQLWGNFNGDFVSLGVFKVSPNPDYFPFTLPGSVNNGPMEFYLTESNAAGSKKPGSNIYLSGKTE